jgi:deazaflavin-dependent oxidoreductase (nitroreductase family)
VRNGDAYVIAGSNGGSPRAPAWYYNLKANPDVEINVGPKPQRHSEVNGLQEIMPCSRTCGPGKIERLHGTAW